MDRLGCLFGLFLVGLLACGLLAGGGVVAQASYGVPSPLVGEDRGCWRVTSRFGWRPGSREGTLEWHNGVDLAACEGSSAHRAVYPLMDGRVFMVDWGPSPVTGVGLYVEVINAWSYDEIPTASLYGHLEPYRVEGRAYALEPGGPRPLAGVRLEVDAREGEGDPLGQSVWPCPRWRAYRIDRVRPQPPEPVTGPDGAFCFVLAPGTYRFRARSPGSEWEARSPQVTPWLTFPSGGERPHDYELRFDFWDRSRWCAPRPTPVPAPSPTPGSTPTPTPTPPPCWDPPFVPRSPRPRSGWGPPVRPGQEVWAYETRLGHLAGPETGAVGRSTGPHLHLEMAHWGGGCLDPETGQVWGRACRQGEVFLPYGPVLNRLQYFRGDAFVEPPPIGTDPLAGRTLLLPAGGVTLTRAFDPLQVLPVIREAGEAGEVLYVGHLPRPGEPEAALDPAADGGLQFYPGLLRGGSGGRQRLEGEKGFLFRFLIWLWRLLSALVGGGGDCWMGRCS